MSFGAQPRRNIKQVVQKMRATVPRVQDVTNAYRDRDYNNDNDMSSHDNSYSPTMMTRYEDDDEDENDEDEEQQQLLRNRFFNRIVNNTQHTMPNANPAVLEHIHISNLPDAETRAATTTTTTTTILTGKKGGNAAGQAVVEPMKTLSLDEAYGSAKCVIDTRRRKQYRDIGHMEADDDDERGGGDMSSDDDMMDHDDHNHNKQRNRRSFGDMNESQSSDEMFPSTKKRKTSMVSNNSEQSRGASDECFLCTWGNEYYDGMSVPHIQEMFRMVKQYHGQMRNTDLAQMIHLYYKEHVYDPSQGMKMLYASVVQDHLENYHSLSASTFVVESLRRYQKVQFLCCEKLCLEDGSVNPKQFQMMNTCQNMMFKIYHLDKRSMILDPKYNPEELNEKARDINLTQRYAYQDERQARAQRKRVTNTVSREVTQFEY